jgi:hypothetical protein
MQEAKDVLLAHLCGDYIHHYANFGAISMAKVSDACKRHCYIQPVCRLDHLRITN